MVMRGAAPSATCPRCGTVSAPSDEPLVHCPTCKLSFDPRSEPVRTRTRKRASTATEVEHGPMGTSLTRAPGEWTIRIPDQRIHGIFYVLVAAALAVVLMEVKGIPGQETIHLVGLGAFILLFAYVGVAKVVNDLTITIDERQLTAVQGPLRMQRNVWIGRAELTKLRAEKTDSQKYPWVVFADTPRGPVAIAGVRDRGKRGQEAAGFVEEAIREGLAATKPEAS